VLLTTGCIKRNMRPAVLPTLAAQSRNVWFDLVLWKRSTELFNIVSNADLIVNFVLPRLQRNSRAGSWLDDIRRIGALF
jgi:hypothetical protein